jgi:membrane-associated phospholipid phosphatase
MTNEPLLDTMRRARRSVDLPVAAAAVVILVVAVGVLDAISVGGPLPIDLSLPPAIMTWYPAAATDLFDTLGALPLFGAVMIAGAIGCLVARRRRLGIAFVLGLCGEILTTIVKLVVDRPRPPGGTEIDALVTAASYPSGHTLRAVLMAGLIIAAVAWRHRRGVVRFVVLVAGVAFGALVGLARIASGEHWPTDVLGGLMLGVAWLTICLVAGEALEQRGFRPRPVSTPGSSAR